MKYPERATGVWLKTDGPLGQIPPFEKAGVPYTSDDTIDSKSLGVLYQHPPPSSTPLMQSAKRAKRGESAAAAADHNDLINPPHVQGSLSAKQLGKQGARATQHASVLIKGIQKLEIPGTFVVQLLSNGNVLKSRAFFQPVKPKDCKTCKKTATINISFLLPLEDVTGGKLSFRIKLVNVSRSMSPFFPLKLCGNPTMNVRLLLEPVTA